MEGRQRRWFTDDYKRQAVDLVASSGRSVGSVAKELGLRCAKCSGSRRPAIMPGARARRAGDLPPIVTSSTTSNGFTATQADAMAARAFMPS